MNRQAERLTLKRRAAIMVLLLFVTVGLVPLTQAADEIAGRNVTHTQKVEMIEVGDIPGHFMGVSQSHGLSFYTKGPESGEVAAKTHTMTFDVVKGAATVTGFEMKTFKDGSTLFIKFSGTQTPKDGGKSAALEGKWEVAGGTGRYAGAKGGGTFKGERIGDPKTGGDNYVDFSGTITK